MLPDIADPLSRPPHPQPAKTKYAIAALVAHVRRMASADSAGGEDHWPLLAPITGLDMLNSYHVDLRGCRIVHAAVTYGSTDE
jgi:hypothetical protein